MRILVSAQYTYIHTETHINTIYINILYHVDVLVYMFLYNLYIFIQNYKCAKAFVNISEYIQSLVIYNHNTCTFYIDLCMPIVFICTNVVDTVVQVG